MEWIDANIDKLILAGIVISALLLGFAATFALRKR
jgi:hypothetical protein